MNAGDGESGWAGYKKYLSLIVLAIFFVWVVVYIRDHWSEFARLRTISVNDLAVIYVLALLGIAFRGFYTAVLTIPYGVAMGNIEAFFISLVSTVGNYTLPMRGGIGLRALYLKRKYKIRYREFARMSVVLFSTTFLIDAVLGLVAVFLLWKLYGRFDLPVTLVLVVALAASTLIQLSSRFSIGDRFPLLERFAGRSKSILKTAGVWRKLVRVTLLNSALRLLWIIACFHAISVDLSILQGLLISSLIPLSMVVTFTPGNLGITEGLLIYVTSIFGIGASSAIICSMLMRSSVIFWSLLMLPFIKRTIQELKKN